MCVLLTGEKTVFGRKWEERGGEREKRNFVVVAHVRLLLGRRPSDRPRPFIHQEGKSVTTSHFQFFLFLSNSRRGTPGRGPPRAGKPTIQEEAVGEKRDIRTKLVMGKRRRNRDE